MNGQYSIKGYLYQSLVALLDSFGSNWESICVEPNNESEKVDIRWNYSNGEIVVALVDDSATVKTFYKEEGYYRLQPENDDMDPIIVMNCEILGKVIGVFRFL